MEEIDWRMKVFATVAEDQTIPWSDHKIKKGDVMKLSSVVNLPRKRHLTIPVPNLTALYINNSEKCWRQYRALREDHKIDSSLKDDVAFKSDDAAFEAIELIATSVISAYTAIEAFCNDSIPENHEYWHNRKSEIIVEKSGKHGIEMHFSTESKLIEILPEIYRVEVPKGKNPVWSSFIKLKSCRDELIHAKSSNTRSVGLESKNLWDTLFRIEKPHSLAKDVFNWYISSQEIKPPWFLRYPK